MFEIEKERLRDITVFFLCALTAISLAVLIGEINEITSFAPTCVVQAPPPVSKTVLTPIEDTKADSVNVAAIKMKSDYHTNFSELPKKLEKLMANHPETDLVVFPEYSLSDDRPKFEDSVQYSIEILCHDTCDVVSHGSVSEGIVEIIHSIQNIAREYNVNIVLGTVFEYANVSELSAINEYYNEVLFTTALIIEEGTGEIIAIRRKTSEWRVKSEKCNWRQNWSCSDALRALSLPSVSAYELQSKEDKTFTIFPVVCSDRRDTIMLDYAYKAGVENIDILVNVEREGDTPYEEIMQNIQYGLSPGDGWDEGINDMIIEEFIVKRPLINVENGYYLVAEGGFANGGIINLNNNPKPLLMLSITDDYVAGKINIGKE